MDSDHRIQGPHYRSSDVPGVLVGPGAPLANLTEDYAGSPSVHITLWVLIAHRRTVSTPTMTPRLRAAETARPDCAEIAAPAAEVGTGPSLPDPPAHEAYKPDEPLRGGIRQDLTCFESRGKLVPLSLDRVQHCKWLSALLPLAV